MEYAFISHASAVEATWSLARAKGFSPLDDEGIWMLPSPEHCVTTQEALEQLMEMGGFKGLGLRSRPIDLLVPTVSSRSRGKLLTCHVWNGFFPERAFIRVHERVFVSSPLFTVLQLALAPHPSRLSRRLAEEAAAEDARIRHELGMEGAAATAQELLAWEAIAREARAIRTMTDFAGTYRPATSPRDGTSYDTAPLMTCNDLKSFLDSQPSMRGARKGYGVAARAFDRSGSPMETALALLLTLPVEMGGFGLPRPALNRSVPLSPTDRGLTSQEEMIADLCWEHEGLVIEYDSWERHGRLGAAKIAKDHARANSLTALGWKTLTVGYAQVASVQGMALLARQAARLLGCELAEPTDLQKIWRSRLHALLMPQDERHA